jgi:protein-S-isoprenylcysteine O-methyltransferase Ste14
MLTAPDLELGFWNAWLVLLVFRIASFGPFFVAGAKAEARMEGEPSFADVGRGTQVATIDTHAVLMPLTLLYGIFVPLERGGAWLLAGLVVSAFAVVLAFAASVTFVSAPLGAPMTHGVYAISRHPMYVAGTLVYLGVGLAATSWVFLLCAALEAVAWRLAVPEEERTMLDKYGAAYEDYMRHTPRWLGLPRSGRTLHAPS